MLLPTPPSAGVARPAGSAITAPRLTSEPVGRQAGTAVLPYGGAKASGTTIPTWTGSVSSEGSTYTYRIVGKDPFVPVGNAATTVTAPILPLVITFDDGTVLDPTAPDPTCSPKGSALDLLLTSPVFKTRDYRPGGTDVGKVQYADAFQRSEFWSAAKPGGANPTYHLRLAPSAKVAYHLAAHSYPTEAAKCGRIGFIDIQTFDTLVRTTLVPFYAASGVSSTTVPVILLYNVIFFNGTIGQCCILGYHSGFTNPGGRAQTYVVGDYDTSGSMVGGVTDVATLSHEVGEWANDAFVNNVTPPWGHIGQVSGCQGNLEVGDPLTGTYQPVTMGNGVSYHPQELAFFSWFFDQSSTGVNGWYSSNGTFTTFAAPCQPRPWSSRYPHSGP